MVDEFAVSLLRESTLVALALPCSSQCSLLHATALLEAHASLGAILVMQARGAGGTHGVKFCICLGCLDWNLMVEV